jgi:hypothetical protein
LLLMTLLDQYPYYPAAKLCRQVHLNNVQKYFDLLARMHGNH